MISEYDAHVAGGLVAINNAKLANMAQATVKGRAAAAGTGVPVDLTAAQVKTIIGGFAAFSVQGLVTGPAGASAGPLSQG